jgi:hypothetical protein
VLVVVIGIRIIGTIVALIVVVVILAVSCLGGGDNEAEPTPEPTPQQSGSGPAEQALARYVEMTLQKQFFEDCSMAEAGRDAGKICSTLRGERAGQFAFVIGLVASEANQWVIVGERAPGQFDVVSTQMITPDNAGVPGIPWPLRTGVDLVVAGSNPCVNVREGPSLNQRAVDCIRDGTRVRLTAGPANADNIQWWQVEGRTGWVAADYLRYPDAAQ